MSEQHEKTVLVERQGAVGIVRLNRPSALNVAPSDELWGVMPPPQIAEVGIAGYAKSARAPVAVKSHADIWAFPRSVGNVATSNRTAVTCSGAMLGASDGTSATRLSGPMATPNPSTAAWIDR